MRTVNGWPLPAGRWIPVEGRGSVFVREVTGPEGAPVVVLLHGLGATSGLQFAATMNQLGEEFRVLAVDMRRASHPHKGPQGLFACVAEDVAAVLKAFDLSRVIVLGYSIGGLVARVLVRRHPDLVAGVVFAATFDQLPRSRWTAPIRSAESAVASLTQLPRRLQRPGATGQPQEPSYEESEGGLARWLLAEIGKLRPQLFTAAIHDAIRQEVPTAADLGERPLAFIVTTRDRVVAPRWQRAFAATAPTAPVFEVTAGHAASGLSPTRFGPVALAACHSVRSRLNGRRERL